MRGFEDKLKKAVAINLKAKPRGSCPGDEELAAFVEGKLSEAEADRVAGHLPRCATCMESVKTVRRILAEAAEETAARLPLAAMARARKLDPAQKGFMEVVVRFAQGVAEVVKMSGGVVGGLAPAANHVRGEGKVVSETLVTFIKDFPPYQAEVDLERSKPDRSEITIRLSDKTTNRPPQGVRVSLYDHDLELESAMLENGQAVFENLKFGQYRVEITRVGEPIGGITLEMKGEGR